MLSKICAKCKTRKQLSSIGRDKLKRDGLACHCRQCRSIATGKIPEREWLFAGMTPADIREQWRQWRMDI